MGVDVGAETIKAIVLSDGEPTGRSAVAPGLEQQAGLERATAEALAAAGVARERVSETAATGVGRGAATGAWKVTEVTAAAKGACALRSEVRTLIDVGAEGARAVRLSDDGRVADFVINEKCAAGAGAFVEAMARALEVPLERMGALSLRSEKVVPLNAQCVVFAESEVVSLIHSRTPKADIARAIHDAIAGRTASMARRVGVRPPVMLVGGMGRNEGFVESLKRALELEEILVPEHPEFVGAYGAALIAAARHERRRRR